MFFKPAAVMAMVAAAMVATGPLAAATERPAPATTTQAPGPDTGDRAGGLLGINLLNNVVICPDVTTLLGLGTILGILGLIGDQDAGGSSIVCLIDRSVSS